MDDALLVSVRHRPRELLDRLGRFAIGCG